MKIKISLICEYKKCEIKIKTTAAKNEFFIAF